MIAMELNQITSKKIGVKKITFGNLLFRIVIFLGLLTWQNAKAATFIDGMYYVLNTSNNTASLASATGEYGNFGGYAGDVVVPSSVIYQDVTYTVTTIQERCFYNCKDITSLTIPASVNKISGTHVFYGCKGIKRVVLEDGDNPITIPGCVYSEQYGNTKATFHYAKLESAYVGRSIKITSSSDSDSPFYGQSLLADVVIGPKVTELPAGFIYGSSISNITIPEGVTKIGKYAFAYCPNLSEIVFPNSLEEIGWGCCSGSAIEKAFVGDNVEILEGTFNSCSNLKSVYLGSGITTIGLNTFAWSNNLSKIYLFSDNLTTLNSPGFPDGLGQIFVNNPDRYKNLIPDKHLDKLIIFNNSISTYSGNLPALNYQNYVEDASVEYSVPNEFINAGSYTIKIPVTFRHKGWASQTSIMASYTINPAQLTVIPESVSRQYEASNPELTCSFFGFKNNETADVLTKQPNIETTATKDSPVGTYPIIATGAEAQNYTFNYERGTLTITKADQTIEWDQQIEVVNVGDVVELTATSSSGLPIKYTTTDESVAEIFTESGKKFVKFLKPGNVSIRAIQEGNENYNAADRISKTVRVDLLVSAITINETSITLAEGASIQLTANITPSTASNKTLIWESSNTGIATVDSNGKVAAIKQGAAVITVKSTDGSNISAQCEVNVVMSVNGISLNISTATLMEGQSLQIEATVSPELANNKTLAWTSSNEAVATVDQNGKVTAIAQGTAVITVSSTDGSDISASCNITVVNPVVSIALSESELTMSAGESKILSAIVYPENATNPAIKWESTNTNVAKVENGIVVAVANGEADIIVSATGYAGIEAICHVTVRTLITEINLDYTELILKEGDSVQLKATVLPNNASDATLIWRSTDPEIATVDDGLVLAHKKGKAQIFAEATDGSGVTAVCEVSVSENSGIENVTGNAVSVYVSNRTIHFDNVAGLDCRVIQLKGSVIYFNNSNSEHKEFSPSTTGIYIVIIGSKSYKIMIQN